MIGAGTSYNFIGGFGLPPDSTSRARCFDTVPQTTQGQFTTEAQRRREKQR
jgi:hypothetical protein